MIWIFLSSGLFLGWSLGANDAANIFGTAIGTKMLRFRTAAIFGSIFVILGAVISGSGAAHTLGKLGDINAVGGAFTVALAAGATVSWMAKLGLPVSTTQAIVGSIVGWDLFTGSQIDTVSLTKIVSTWFFSPLLAGIFAFILFNILKFYLKRVRIHLLQIDNFTRIGLLLIGIFGAYSLGANNIANVMGVFMGSNPFKGLSLGFFYLNDIQVLFMVGGFAIALGIFTYSYKVITTVGRELHKLSPLAALVVVLAESLVLFIFASQSLERFLVSMGIPPLPLVPVSSSQAVVGAIVGIGIARGGGRAINFKKLYKIVIGWFLTPLSSGILSFFLLFFMQNVFQVSTYRPIKYAITEYAYIDVPPTLRQAIEPIKGEVFANAREFKEKLSELGIKREDTGYLLSLARIDSIYIDSMIAKRELDQKWFGKKRIEAVKKLHGRIFVHKWQVVEELSKISDEWKFRSGDRRYRVYNRELQKMYDTVFHVFSIQNIREKFKISPE